MPLVVLRIEGYDDIAYELSQALIGKEFLKIAPAQNTHLAAKPLGTEQLVTPVETFQFTGWETFPSGFLPVYQKMK